MIRNVAVIGTGVIGAGWIIRCLAHNKKVVAFDKDLKLKKRLPRYINSFPIDKNEITKAILTNKNNLKKIESILKKNSVHFDLLGETTDKDIIIDDEPTFTVDKVTEFYKGWLYKYMS